MDTKEKVCKIWLLPNSIKAFVLDGMIYYNGNPSDETVRLAFARINMIGRIGKWRYYFKFLRAWINHGLKNNPLEIEAKKIM